MNEGLLAMLIIVATIGAGVVVAMYRDLIFTGADRQGRRPNRVGRPGPRPPRAIAESSRSPRAWGDLVKRSEIAAKPAAIVSVAVSGSTAPKDDDEMIACRALAKLIRAGVVTETIALERAFDVSAGSGKAYKAVQAKLKTALSELDLKN